MRKEEIRNFCIIAHIDHGKSTLADRFLELTNTLAKRDLKERFLDSMDLERERGITIKLKAVRLEYKGLQLNLIDTPGHVDFSYEVSRSLAACEGAVLVVDATQGIQAQTLSNVYKALDAGLEIIPVVNKIDLPSSEPKKVADDMAKTFGIKKEAILFVSAKTGQNVEILLDEIVRRVPHPGGNENAPFRSLIFDSFYDEYLGVVAVVKVVDGSASIGEAGGIKPLKPLKFFATGAIAIPEEIGIFKPQRTKTNFLVTGEVGYIATGLKEIKKVRVGDTIFFESEKNIEPLLGYKESKPVVFTSIFPIDNDSYTDFREALQKLSLSDSSLTFEPESSPALGFGFRCGFLGLLHADVCKERLEREYNLELISLTPNVSYKIEKKDSTEVEVRAPSLMPDPSSIKKIFEPWVLLKIYLPSAYTGAVMKICEEHRGALKSSEYLTPEKLILEYELPFAELIVNFYDGLKSVTSGYASLDYDFVDLREVDAVKLDILVQGNVVDPLSQIVVRERARKVGREVLSMLKEAIPRHQFEIVLKAAVSSKVIARESIQALRKDVLLKMSGGHRERKDKLLDKQKEGKKRLKRFGKVDIPQEAFRTVLART